MTILVEKLVLTNWGHAVIFFNKLKKYLYQKITKRKYEKNGYFSEKINSHVKNIVRWAQSTKAQTNLRLYSRKCDCTFVPPLYLCEVCKKGKYNPKNESTEREEVQKYTKSTFLIRLMDPLNALYSPRLHQGLLARQLTYYNVFNFTT